MASQFGKTWWGQEWLNSLSKIDYSNRLARGSSYARKGMVSSMEISKNIISAKVKGSMPKPYDVEIKCELFSEENVKSFISLLSTKPSLIANLLNRKLDESIISIAKDCGLKIFPSAWTDLKMSCSCPDFAVPCKHLASVIYQTSVEIDNNPFLAFELHGMDIPAELSSVPNISLSKEEVVKPIDFAEYILKGKNLSSKKEVKNVSKDLDFPAIPKIEPLGDVLQKLLADNPPFYVSKNNFKDKYIKKVNGVVKLVNKSLADGLSLKSKTIPKLNYESEGKLSLNKNGYTTFIYEGHSYELISLFNAFNEIDFYKKKSYHRSIYSLIELYNFALLLLSKGAFVPRVFCYENNDYGICWQPAILSKEVNDYLSKVDVLNFNCLWYENKKVENNEGFHIISQFISSLLFSLFESNEDNIIDQLLFENQRYAFNKPGESAVPGGIETWLGNFYRVHSEEEMTIRIEEGRRDNFNLEFDFNIKQKSKISKVSFSEIQQSKKYESLRFQYIQYLTKIKDFIPGVNTYIDQASDSGLQMDMASFTNFLFELMPAIELLQIEVLLPKSLNSILRPKPSIKVKKVAVGGNSHLSLVDVLDFDWKVAIGDTLIDEKEYKQLISKTNELIKYKSQYIYASKEEVEKIHNYFTKSKGIDRYSLLRSVLSEDFEGSIIEISDEIKDMIHQLTEIKEVPLPNGLHAQLRPYQHRGFSWMYKNNKIGIGSVMADDMGLGKTLQVITFILKCKEEKLLEVPKILVVTPTGLLPNWQSEIEKFAPSLKAHIFHGSQRAIPKATEYDVMLTSYGLLRTEIELFKKQKWYAIIIDEAQNIKNVNAAQTKAIKQIKANTSIAMSGTPVENRLSELWSIFDFTNGGLLGNLSQFKNNYSKAIEKEGSVDVANKLKKVTAPFMMRRLKTDKTIISDIPDKIEVNDFATLTKEQSILYKKVVKEAMDLIQNVNGSDSKTLFKRQGLILQMILTLKQVCNHPAQFTKQKVKSISVDDSGKCQLLIDRLDSILASEEKVLIFTQFTEMGEMLSDLIYNSYSIRPLYYHGACTLEQRKAMVDKFQNNKNADRIFILSLKAAGTGLNLTAANHVIHYDLWWNPAVEAQATDRAFRIGQNKNVLVYRFITQNTFEEKINDMIQSKKDLANLTVGTGESWIGKMSDSELMEVFG